MEDLSERMKKRGVSDRCFCGREPEIVPKHMWPVSTPTLIDTDLQARFKYIVRCPSKDKCAWCFYV
jgi:hypothetical protein